MKLNRRYTRSIRENRSFYLSSTVLTVVTLLLYFLFNIAGNAILDFSVDFYERNKIEDAHFTTYMEIPEEELQELADYDGIVIDKVWVGHSKFWVLPGTEDIPFVQTWGQVLKKRCVLTLIWIAGAAVTAGLVVLIFKVPVEGIAAQP